MSDCSTASGCSSPASSPTQSIAFSVAKLAQEQGATVVLTGFGRLSLVERIAKRLPEPAPVIELDVTNAEHLAGAGRQGARARRRPRRRGALDRLRAAERLGGGFLDAPWEDVATALHVSTYSLQVAGDGRAAADGAAAARSSG